MRVIKTTSNDVLIQVKLETSTIDSEPSITMDIENDRVVGNIELVGTEGAFTLSELEEIERMIMTAVGFVTNGVRPS